MASAEAEDRVGVASVDVAFLKNLKLGAEPVGKRADLLLVPRLLPSKLIAWKGENAQAPLIQATVQLHKLLVIARRQASFACDVDHECDASFKLAQWHGPPAVEFVRT